MRHDSVQETNLDRAKKAYVMTAAERAVVKYASYYKVTQELYSYFLQYVHAETYHLLLTKKNDLQLNNASVDEILEMTFFL